MAKCVCERTCQVIRGKKAVFYTQGDVGVFDKCPPHFKKIKGKIDFATAGEQELTEAPLDALKAFIKGTYGVSAGSKGKEKTVAMLLDCRGREAVLPPEANKSVDEVI